MKKNRPVQRVRWSVPAQKSILGGGNTQTLKGTIKTFSREEKKSVKGEKENLDGASFGGGNSF